MKRWAYDNSKIEFVLMNFDTLLIKYDEVLLIISDVIFHEQISDIISVTILDIISDISFIC